MSTASKSPEQAPAATEPRADLGAVVPSPAQLELQAVRTLAQSIASSQGVEIVEVLWASGPQGRILRVTVERTLSDEEMARIDRTVLARSGVKLEHCVRVSRELSGALDEAAERGADVVAGAYSLEVSSPGVDRPLVKAQDYRRHVGLMAKVKLRTPAADGQRVLRGVIEGFDDALTIDVDGNVHRVALDDVAQARLVFTSQKGEKRKPSRGRSGAKGQAKKSNRGKSSLTEQGAEHRLPGQPSGEPNGGTS